MMPKTLYQQGDIVVVQFPFTDMSQTKKDPLSSCPMQP